MRRVPRGVAGLPQVRAWPATLRRCEWNCKEANAMARGQSSKEWQRKAGAANGFRSV